MNKIFELKDRFERVSTKTLKDLLVSSGIAPRSRIFGACLYSMSDGKRIRPLFVYIINQILGGRLDDADELALSIEILHTFTLIHDDLPLLDDDKLRRNKPTTHIMYGGATALLAGDVMLPLAFSLSRGRANEILARYAVEVSYGQALELEDGWDRIDIMKKKTASLIKASLCLGAISAGREDMLSMMESLGELLGVAFQMQDDIFDGEDNGLRPQELFAEASEIVKTIDVDGMLGDLVDFIKNRSY